MPRRVDVEERRNAVLAAVWRVVERDGLPGATMRAIAQEAGASTAVITHYFNNKDEVLRAALELSHLRIAVSDDTSRERHLVSRDRSLELLEQLVEGAEVAGDLSAGLGSQRVAEALLAFVDGLGVDALCTPIGCRRTDASPCLPAAGLDRVSRRAPTRSAMTNLPCGASPALNV